MSISKLKSSMELYCRVMVIYGRSNLQMPDTFLIKIMREMPYDPPWNNKGACVSQEKFAF